MTKSVVRDESSTETRTSTNVVEPSPKPPTTTTPKKKKHVIMDVDGRWNHLEEGVEMFHDYLTSTKSIILPASFRWAIALETRHCLMGCKGCNDLNQGALCARDGLSAYKLIKNSVPHTSSPNLPYEVTDRSSWERVRYMIHSTINHQARADKEWYHATIKSLGHTNLVNKKKYPEGSERRKLLVTTLYSEILATILASHAIHTLYLVAGQSVPDLPPFESDLDNKLPCTHQDIVTAGLFKKGKGIHYDKFCHVPTVLYKNIDSKSEVYQSYPKVVRDYLKENMQVMHPLISLSMAPQAMAICGILLEEKIGMPAQTYTAKPMIEPLLKNAVAKAIVELGEATLLECAAALAYGEAITKASDLSGRKGMPKGVQFVVSKLVPVLKAFSK